MLLWTLRPESSCLTYRNEMGKYKVTTGQNLYDIALHIYGSIEGIVDLMMCNPDLSLSTVLKNGDELLYTDEYIINQNVVSFNAMYGIIPSNNERNVYPKYPAQERLLEICIKSSRTFVDFSLNGKCYLEIDWGDNSPLEVVTLNDSNCILHHVFNNQCKDFRKIRVYGNGEFKEIIFNSLDPVAIYPTKPVRVGNISAQNTSCPLDYLTLMQGIYRVSLNNCSIDSLLPLLPLLDIGIIDLTDARLSRIALDNYLISVVNNYGMRRNILMYLTTEPNGSYQEPYKDTNNRYVISNGMEAIWVINHEPAWNEAGAWIFNINGNLYTCLS